MRRVDNVEGITLGPRLPDGRRTVLLVSDDNFSAVQTTQFLAFAATGI
ncbi:esterase-like activity of phytase family protein [Streptomyces ipomoeae]|nr:esterase-like activity of phytase family protein [Streptomyces ipomoeae]MDX2939877.1 esterase-like activity of phytase family protein [Streptomyces ipomoeae]